MIARLLARWAHGPRGAAWQTSRRDDAAAIAAGSWLAVGLFVDGWAHNNLRSLETFFTPWHAILYSGFVAVGAWYLGLAIRGTRRRATRHPADAAEGFAVHGPSLPWRAIQAGFRGRIPVGYGWGVAGVFVFALGGLGDMSWHVAFGIEQGIDALFSPMHLVLAVGLVTILGAPFRAAWYGPTARLGTPWRDLVPATVSAALVASTIAFFFMHAWPTLRVFHVGRPASPFPLAGGEVRSAAISAGTGGMIAMTLVMVGAVLWLAMRWRLPLGAATVIFATVSTLMAGIGGFANWPLVAAQVGAGVAADGLAWTLDPTPDRPWRFRAYAFAVALVLWMAVLATDSATRGLGWSREVNGGAVAWSCLAALALASAMTTRAPARA